MKKEQTWDEWYSASLDRDMLEKKEIADKKRKKKARRKKYSKRKKFYEEYLSSERQTVYTICKNDKQIAWFSGREYAEDKACNLLKMSKGKYSITVKKIYWVKCKALN